MRIERGYVKIRRRHVHYRRAGSGPAIVLLHASPVSSAMFLDQLGVYAERFTAIALDTPGYGLSDPLGIERPAIAHYADALVETLDALGLDRTLLYGRHTGASIAVEAARRHPSRVVQVLCDGYPIFPPEVRQHYLEDYLVPLVPRWDGSHLAFWWLRYREQHVFWPWDIQTSAKRADADVPDLDFLNRGFTSIMEAGDGYRIGYAAAFLHDAVDALAELRVPCWLTARPGDSLFARFGDVPDGHEKRILPRDTVEAAVVEREMFETVRAEASTPSFPVVEDLLDGDRIFLPIEGGSLHARFCGTLSGRKPLVLIAPQPGGLASIASDITEIGAHWPVLGIEAPAQADSETPDPGSVEVSADWIIAALSHFGHKPSLVAGIRGSAGIAVEIGQRLGLPVALLDPPLMDAATREAYQTNYPVDITPRQEGGHVLTAWTLLRDERIWAPWYDRRRVTALPHISGLEAAALHARAVDLLKQPYAVRSLMTQVWRHPLADRAAALATPCWMIRGPNDIFAAQSSNSTLRTVVAAPDNSVAMILARMAQGTEHAGDHP